MTTPQGAATDPGARRRAPRVLRPMTQACRFAPRHSRDEPSLFRRTKQSLRHILISLFKAVYDGKTT